MLGGQPIPLDRWHNFDPNQPVKRSSNQHRNTNDRI
jgi:hypothetical protein